MEVLTGAEAEASEGDHFLKVSVSSWNPLLLCSLLFQSQTKRTCALIDVFANMITALSATILDKQLTMDGWMITVIRN